MDGSTLGVLVGIAGTMAIFGIAGFAAYRVGKFTVLPGEPKRLATWGTVAVLLAGGFALITPWIRRNFGSAADLVFAVIPIVLVVLLARSGPRREAAMAKRSPEEQAEFARRSAFFASRQGRRFIVGAGLGVVAWLLASTFIFPPG